MVYIVLLAIIGVCLFIDLVVLHKKDEVPTNQRTAMESMYWMLLALSFSFAVYWIYQNNWVENMDNLTPMQATIKYLTGYLVELSLSVDNLFVMALIFSSMKIPEKFQHRVLFWGILGALFFRAILIFPGAVLIHKISWITYVFGAFLFYTAIKMLKKDDDDGNSISTTTKFISRFVPVTNTFNGQHFWIKEDGISKATPLFSALMIVEMTDIMFALDSIPAVLAITTDPFIVFSSNIFAILGLRAMYFFLVNMLHQFYYIKYSVFVILVFVAIKLIILHHVEIPEFLSLLVIVVALLGGIIYSKMNPVQQENTEEPNTSNTPHQN